MESFYSTIEVPILIAIQRWWASLRSIVLYLTSSDLSTINEFYCILLPCRRSNNFLIFTNSHVKKSDTWKGIITTAVETICCCKYDLLRRIKSYSYTIDSWRFLFSARYKYFWALVCAVFFSLRKREYNLDAWVEGFWEPFWQRDKTRYFLYTTQLEDPGRIQSRKVAPWKSLLLLGDRGREGRYPSIS